MHVCRTEGIPKPLVFRYRKDKRGGLWALGPPYKNSGFRGCAMKQVGEPDAVFFTGGSQGPL